MGLSASREAMDRSFKGLSDAKTRVDQATQEDASYPDLIDQLNAQSEPQNYFFEPYASQWTPQVAKKGSVIPLPGVVAAALDDTKTLSLSGLLPEIRSAWTSVDSRLFLWSYAQRGRFAAKEFDQAVVAVGLVTRPATGIFTSKVRHVLVVATTVEVLLLAVVADDNQPERPDGTGPVSFKLQRTKLSVSTDKCVVRKIVTTRSGRIFFGGSDGALYEFLYTPEQKAAADRNSLLGAALPGVGALEGCRKVAHTSSYAQYLPRFLAGLASAPGKVVDMCVDHSRHILYVLHDDAQVSVFDLGANGDENKAVCAANMLADGAKYARENRRTRVSCPDERLFQPAVAGTNPLKVVALSTVSPDESKTVTLVAVTSNGIRFYLSAFSRRYTYSGAGNYNRAKRPSRLEILHIRLPPPAIALRDAPPYHAKEGMQPGYAPGKSPSAVHVAFHRKGVFLCIEGRRDQQDQLVGIAHDPISTTALPVQTGLAARKPTIREAVSLDTCIGKVVDVQELDPYSSEGPESSWIAEVEVAAAAKASKGANSGSKRSFDEMSTGIPAGAASENVPVVGEMALMYSQPSRHFLCLTNSGIQVFKKIRPLDQLHRALLLSRGHELKAALAPFVRCFGEIQVVCMLVALACGVPTDPLVSETSTAASLIAPRPGGLTTMKSDDYIYTSAVQGIFELAQGPPDNVPVEPAASSTNSTATSASSTRIVLTTEFGMSYQHDGLVAFACRVLRPLWTSKTLGRRVVSRVVNGTKPAAKAPGYVASFENIHSPEKMDEIREILFQLRQLMESAGPFAVSISGGAALEKNPSLDGVLSESAEAGLSRVSELVMRHQKSLNEDQLKRETRFKAEQRSLYYLYQLVLRSIEAISLLRIAQEYKVSLEEPLARLSFSDLVTTTDGSLAAKTMTKALMRGRNENNQFLIKQLREQCPTFFSVSDLWHYQGYRSLSNAKLSGSPVARKNFLKESLEQFLNSCHMWDTEDCLDVLQGICEDYTLLNYYEGVVKLSLACAKHFHDAAASDLSGVKQTWKRRCFGCILLALHKLLGGAANASPQAVEEMVTLDDETRNKCVEELFHFALASEDDSFHNLLYTWLYERGHSHLLTSIRSPYIEEFLKEKDQDLLVKLYMDQHKYLVAAKVWWARAHEDSLGEDEYATSSALVVSNNPDIVKRQYYVSKALGCLKSLEDVGEAAEAIKEVRDVLDVLQLQVRVLKALEQQVIELETTSSTSDEELRQRKTDVQLLTFKLFDASTLYNRFTSKYDMWMECLHIIHVCKSEEADVIATLWRKIIFSLLPQSSSNAAFNAWRLDQCEKAGLLATSSSAGGGSSFESGNWIGQMQCKILRLGKALYLEGDDAHSGSAAGIGGFVFPVGFLADVLEWISLWYIRSTGVGAFTGSVASAAAIDATTFNWVLKLFLDVGVPHRVLLSYYEQLYREQPERLYREGWTVHLLQSMLAIITIWKKHAISPRAGKDQLAEFAACCPSIVDLCDGFITDLRATSHDDGEASTLLEQFRRVKGELLNFRTLM
ncbi:Nuclear pore complex protein [Phytophthora citrophthora]|uniref:Nuclear pore complex protein n=1 Tax=Phytophthora citrophthora TaxID=4793 RepID=A0AAD9G5V5_9STRA|nr:Nuclear pore complex protein [Phytophthora citrophthora]